MSQILTQNFTLLSLFSNSENNLSHTDLKKSRRLSDSLYILYLQSPLLFSTTDQKYTPSPRSAISLPLYSWKLSSQTAKQKDFPTPHLVSVQDSLPLSVSSTCSSSSSSPRVILRHPRSSPTHRTHPPPEQRQKKLFSSANSSSSNSSTSSSPQTSYSTSSSELPSDLVDKPIMSLTSLSSSPTSESDSIVSSSSSSSSSHSPSPSSSPSSSPPEKSEEISTIDPSLFTKTTSPRLSLPVFSSSTISHPAPTPSPQSIPHPQSDVISTPHSPSETSSSPSNEVSAPISASASFNSSPIGNWSHSKQFLHRNLTTLPSPVSQEEPSVPSTSSHSSTSKILLKYSLSTPRMRRNFTKKLKSSDDGPPTHQSSSAIPERIGGSMIGINSSSSSSGVSGPRSPQKSLPQHSQTSMHLHGFPGIFPKLGKKLYSPRLSETSEVPNSPTAQNNQKNKTPKKAKKSSPMFGVPLSQACSVNRRVPLLISRSLQYLEQSMKEEGLFRLPGAYSEIQELKLAAQQKVYDFSQVSSVHNVSALVQMYLSELPEPVVPFAFYEPMLAAADKDKEERTQIASGSIGSTSPSGTTISNYAPDRLLSLLKQFPMFHLETFELILKFLGKLSNYSQINKMSASNLGNVFAPILLRPEVEVLDRKKTMLQALALELLIEYFAKLQLRKLNHYYSNSNSTTSSSRSKNNFGGAKSNVQVSTAVTSPSLSTTTTTTTTTSSSNQNLEGQNGDPQADTEQGSGGPVDFVADKDPESGEDEVVSWADMLS